MSPFDEAKYTALLERLEVTEVTFKEVVANTDFRIDAEFYRKLPSDNPAYSYILIGQILKNTQYGISIDMNEDGVGFPIYRMNEITNMLCNEQLAKCADISPAEAQPYLLQDGDVLFNRTNSQAFVGRTGIYKAFSNDQRIFASYLVRFVPDEKRVLPEYLTAFLNSQLGILDIKRRARISINQSNVNAEEVKAVRIPLIGMRFQLAIKNAFDKAHQLLTLSKQKYRHAEQTLLRALGLENWQPPEPLSYTRRASEAFAANRLDAEHYQPKYDDMLRHIEAKGVDLVSLGELILPVKNGYDWREFVDEGTPYVRVGDISQCRINLDAAEKVAITVTDVPKDISLQVGDALFTRKGSFGNAAPVREGDEHSIISSEIMLIRRRPKLEKKFLPEYFALFFNSVAGNLQAEKWAHGAAFYSVSQDDLNRFLIPMLPEGQQNELRELLETSEAARRQASDLLDRAKRAVEIAIEENEAAAMKFLNKAGETTDA